jgi:hypothetical protein
VPALLTLAIFKFEFPITHAHCSTGMTGAARRLAPCSRQRSTRTLSCGEAEVPVPALSPERRFLQNLSFLSLVRSTHFHVKALHTAGPRSASAFGGGSADPHAGSFMHRSRSALGGRDRGSAFGGGRRGSSGHDASCGGCAWCRADAPDASAGREQRMACGEFTRLKFATARYPYLEVELKPPELAGFAAAGMLVTRRDEHGAVELLLAREYRGHTEGGSDLYPNGTLHTTNTLGSQRLGSRFTADKLNFLGGKRDIKMISALDVAVGKLDAETGGALQRATLAEMRSAVSIPIVFWSAHSRYVLFAFELTSKADLEVDVNCVGAQGAKRLEWVPRSALCDGAFRDSELHVFAAHMLGDLIKSNVLGRLEELFDCADKISAAKQAASAETAFDVLSVLRESAAAARPGTTPLPRAPTGKQITFIVALLHDVDKRKMRLRFHPDRLQRTLARSPTEAEVAMANLAMSAVNLMFEQGGDNSKSLQAALKELDALRSPSAATVDANDVSKLLASIKVGRRASSIKVGRRASI